MPTRDDETPPAPHVAAGFAEIERRVRARSTRTTELAGVTAMEVALIFGIDPRTDPRIDEATLKIRGLIERILDGAAQPECERCKRREELRRRSDDR